MTTRGEILVASGLVEIHILQPSDTAQGVLSEFSSLANLDKSNQKRLLSSPNTKSKSLCHKREDRLSRLNLSDRRCRELANFKSRQKVEKLHKSGFHNIISVCNSVQALVSGWLLCLVTAMLTVKVIWRSGLSLHTMWSIPFSLPWNTKEDIFHTMKVNGDCQAFKSLNHIINVHYKRAEICIEHINWKSWWYNSFKNSNT